MKAQVEYFAGPFDGRTEHVLVGADQRPGEFHILEQGPYYRSALDDEPYFPAQDHHYRRATTQPVQRAGAEVWLYTWSGPLR